MTVPSYSLLTQQHAMSTQAPVMPAQAGILPRFAGILALACLLLASCNEVGIRDNVTDPNADNYDPQAALSSACYGMLCPDPAGSSARGSSSSSSVAMCTNINGANIVTDCRDNHTYKTVVIGTQTWLAENLAYLPSVSAAKATDNYTTYGVLYNWTAAMAGACPHSWHLPSTAEWATLETFVGGSRIAGTKLKSVSGWTTDGVAGTDSYGFSALPGGFYDVSDFYNVLYSGYWWTATEYGSADAYKRIMDHNFADVFSFDYYKSYGFSVRCLQDDSGTSGTSSAKTISSSSAASSQVIFNTQTCTYTAGSPYGSLACNEKVYKTVTITSASSSLTLMAENLNIGTRVDGFASTCNSTTCAAQISASHHQGICPVGWHIPKAAEWNLLATMLGGSTVAGQKMKLNITGYTS